MVQAAVIQVMNATTKGSEPGYTGRMPDHDREDPLDRARLPARLEQPNDKLVRYHSAEAQRSDMNTCEQDANEVPTRWQRIQEHPALKPVLVVSGIVVACGITLLTWRTPEGIKHVAAAALVKVPEYTESAFDSIAEVASRRSPVQHVVNGYERVQRYGPGGTEAKIIKISSHIRGGSA
ncbi:hypothetical protein GCM10009636_10750 [Arthrobacter koreensis]